MLQTNTITRFFQANVYTLKVSSTQLWNVYIFPYRAVQFYKESIKQVDAYKFT